MPVKKTIPLPAVSADGLKEHLGVLFSSRQPAAAKAKEQSLAGVRDWLNVQKQALKDDFTASGDVDTLLDCHTSFIDALIAGLHDVSVQDSSAIAVIAVGGYGRRDLFPYSDIDLLFLYDESKSEEAARTAEFILYVLWDLGLSVGQAHRSVEETIKLAQEDITIRTNLLDARLVVGDRKIFALFEERFAKEIEDNVGEFIEAKLAERDARHQRFGDSRYMLEPNVKEGKGGLRDLHTLWWLARYAYPISSLSELVPMKLLTEEEYRTFDQARHFLCRVRACLHYLSERAEERVTFDRQHALAVAMGYAHPEPHRAIGRFMRRYFVAVRTVGNVTRIFCALLEDEKKRRPRGSLWYSHWSFSAFGIDGERLNVKDAKQFEENPVLMLEMFRVSQLHGRDIHPHALQAMARNLKRIDDEVRNDIRANAIFLDILLSHKDAETTLRRMSEAGVLGRFIPDFGRVVGQTQFNMYHVYTVDEHTLVAIGILHALERGDLKSELPVASHVIGRVQMRRVLYLALFCHDIAKGKGGDHSEMGEKIATRLAERCGFSIGEQETVAWLVRNHLLFTNTVFKRDIDDPQTVQDFVAAVRSSERLRLLFVLTVADIRAVGPAIWNAWKASLLRDLYHRAEQSIGVGRAEIRTQHLGELKTALTEQLSDWNEDEIDAYLDQGSPGFWAYCEPSRHAFVASAVKENALLRLDIRHDPPRTITEIVVCTPDQPALFSKIAGAMALSGANIINARIFTLKGGMAVDIFQVQDTAGALFDASDRLARLTEHLGQTLSGALDISKALAARPSVSPRREAVPVPAEVFIENEASSTCTIIEISGRDRPGFLYDVTHIMAEEGLTIATAHIFTYGNQVADVFYVKDNFGMKVTHDVRIAKIRDALLAAISPAPV